VGLRPLAGQQPSVGLGRTSGQSEGRVFASIETLVHIGEACRSRPGWSLVYMLAKSSVTRVIDNDNRSLLPISLPS